VLVVEVAALTEHLTLVRDQNEFEVGGVLRDPVVNVREEEVGYS